MSSYSEEWYDTEMQDAVGKVFDIGDTVVRAVTLGSGSAVKVSLSKVTDIREGKIYLDDSKIGVRYPCRLLNLTKYTP